jgi:hypothetical protein
MLRMIASDSIEYILAQYMHVTAIWQPWRVLGVLDIPDDNTFIYTYDENIANEGPKQAVTCASLIGVGVS